MNTRVYAATLLALSLGSCAPIKNTLRLDTRLFVRVPLPLSSLDENKDYQASGWTFHHVVQGPHAKDPEAQWFMAVHPSKGHKTALLSLWRSDRALDAIIPEVAQATYQAFKVYPQIIEPNLINKPEKSRTRQGIAKTMQDMRAQQRPHAEPVNLAVREKPHPLWPAHPKTGQQDPFWYQSDDFTQLASAREQVRQKTGGAARGIKIAILDNGYDRRHDALPRHMPEKEVPMADMLNHLGCFTHTCSIEGPGHTNDGHGMGTLGILAGPRITITDKNHKPVTAELGAAPDASIVPVRIAPWVISLSTANFATAIDYASREQGCDVISMSHGGAPSMMWMDALNAAYDRGTAMFAATSDYVNVPTSRLGIIGPSATVFPAASRRVVGVAGITAAHRDYARTDWKHYLSGFFKPSHWFDKLFLLRGSYGPDGVWRTPLSKSHQDDERKMDGSQMLRHGSLHAHPIAACSPAIPWLSYDEKTKASRVDLDGGGTSASTPQVAGAAALWMAAHRHEFSAQEWQSWKKPEAVYTALLLTADRRAWAKESKREDQKGDTYLGAGTLKARDALSISYAKARSLNGKTLHWPTSPTGAPRDFYDGYRSFANMLFAKDASLLYKYRLMPRLEKVLRNPSAAERQQALEDIYFNAELLQEWKAGRVSLNEEGLKAMPLARMRKAFRVNEPEITARAQAKAAKAMQTKP